MTNTILINSQNLNGLINANLFVEDFNNQLIYVSELTDLFGLGYNSFLVGVKQDAFQIGSYLHVFFADKNGSMIPVIVTEYRQKLMIRCYVEVTQQSQSGFGTLVIAGTLTNYKRTKVPKNWQSKINVKHQRKIYVNNHEKTPSVLRFRNKPTITVSPNEKQLFDHKTEKRTEIIPISDLYFDKNHSNYFCFSINTSSFTQSVFYEKKLRYQTVSNISDVHTFNEIFSGSSTTLPQQGQYYGNLLSATNPVIFDTANIFIYCGKLSLGSVSNSAVSKLIGQNIDSFKIKRYESPFGSRHQSFGDYSIYAENSTESISIEQMDFSHTGSKIRPIQFISWIQKSDDISFETTRFLGTISSIQGRVYSQEMIVSSSVDIYGKYKDDLIKGDGIFPLQKFQSGQLLINKQFTHSDAPVILSSTKSTILSNCYISNSYFQNNSSLGVIDFGFIQGNIYSKLLINQQKLDDDLTSYFSGSLKGIGNFYVKTSGSRLIDYTTSILDSGSYIEMLHGYQFCGEGYNANIDIESFTGIIYSSSLTNKEVYLYQTYSDISFSKLIVQSQYFDCILNNLSVLQVSIPNGYITPQTLSVSIEQQNSGSYIKLISQTPFSIDIPLGSKILLDGYFNVAKQELTDVQFNGYYQIAQGYYQIQKYNIISAQLTPKYEKIFGTRQVEFFDNQYDKFYVPIAFVVRDLYYDTSSWKSLIYTNSTYSVEMSVIYENELNEPEFIADSEVVPLDIIISDIDIYSGYFNSLQVLYNDTLNTENYQFLSLIQIPFGLSFPITKSIDLPILSFSGESTNLLFKPKDPLGRYCPEDYFHTEYDVKLNAQYLLNLSRIYNVTYLGGSTIGGSVVSVNNMTGQVMIMAQHIPYDHAVLTNVDLALDYLLIHGGGGSGSGGSTLTLNFDNKFISYNIGYTQSAVTFSWTYSPRVLSPTAQYYYLYTSQYPFQNNWQLITSSTLAIGDNIIEIQGEITNSLKLTVTYMDSLNQSYSESAYCYFRNYIIFGTQSSTTYDYNLLSGFSNITLSNTYSNKYVCNPILSQYIYFSCPSYMTSSYQPEFIVNHIAGGFTKCSVVGYTNSEGYQETYSLYRSFNSNLSKTFLTIRVPNE